MAEATFHFPSDFLWGTATAAHQVEGDNRYNDWWEWEQQGSGRIFGNQTSGLACDWWGGRAEEDIERMVALHTTTHRLSIEWSRIEPKPGEWDKAAIERYRAILETMRRAGIRPMITLHHFTNPTWVARRGGWAHPDSPEWFRAYVKKVVPALSDLCTLWCTINEPEVYAAQGYFVGKWPPGQKDVGTYFRVIYNLLRGHAAAYHQIHDIQPTAQVGLAKHMVAWYPLRNNPLDRAITNLLDRAFNGVILDALQTGQWRPPIGRRGEIGIAKGTLDWIGLNYYQRYDAWFNPAALGALGISYAARPGQPKGPEGWGEFYPLGLYELIQRLYHQFHLPIYITENGIPDEFDRHRPAFILEHLHQVWRAVNFNVPVMGYYFWSLIDNFEWAEGYDSRFRFGLYGVDWETQARTLRKSGELYAEIARSGSISSDMARRYAPQTLEQLFPGKGPQDLILVE